MKEGMILNCNKQKIAAGIVLYNPDVKKIKEVISSVIIQVEFLVLVDNLSYNIKEVSEFCKTNPNIFIIKNNRNEGIAKGLNQIVTECRIRGYEWVLTIDQDSVVRNSLISRYQPYTYSTDVGQITCLIKDVNIGIMHGEGMREECRYVERCITSGALLNVNACISCGLFDEQMFIDYVDFDMCITMRENGYKILQIKYLGNLRKIYISFHFTII